MKNNIFIITALLIMSVPFIQSCDGEEEYNEENNEEINTLKKLSFEIICEDTIAPCIVQFNNTSIGYDKFFWEFGDGSTSEEKNPTHEYETDSTYEVILRDKDDNANYVKKTFKVYDYRDKRVGFYNCDVYKKNYGYNSNNDLIISYDTVTDIVEVEKTGDSLLIMSMIPKQIPSGSVVTALLKEDGSFNSSYDSSGLWGFNGNFVNDSVYLYFVIGGHSGHTEYRYSGVKNNN